MKNLLYLLPILFIFSCDNIKDNTSPELKNKVNNTSFTLNPAHTYDVDSVIALDVKAFVTTIQDSITLKKRGVINHTFKFINDSIEVFYKVESYNTHTDISFHSLSGLGCIEENPKIVFVNDLYEDTDHPVTDIELKGRSTCAPPYFYSNSFLYEKPTYFNLMLTYTRHVPEKLRLIKNDSTYIDMNLDLSNSIIFGKISSSIQDIRFK